MAMAALAGNFYQDFDIMFGDQRLKILEEGKLVTLSLDKVSGAGFQSKNGYIFGRFDVQMKMPPGNSAGTVTTFYVTTLNPYSSSIVIACASLIFLYIFALLIIETYACICSYLLQVQIMMRLTWSFWATPLGSPTLSILMSMPKGRGPRNNNSTYGLIPQRTSTPTPLFGTASALCK